MMKKLLLFSAMVVIGLQSFSHWLPQANGFITPSPAFAFLQISINDPGNPIVIVPAVLVVSDFLPPSIVINPDALMQQIAPNQIETQEMTIGNIGEGPLSYYIDIEYVESTSPEENVIAYQALSWLSISP